MKLSDLFEGKTVILEARHDDMWKEFEQSSLRFINKTVKDKLKKNAAENIFKELISRSFEIDYYMNELKSITTHASWKQMFAKNAISIISYYYAGDSFIKDWEEYEAIKTFFRKKVIDGALRPAKLFNDIEHFSSIDHPSVKIYNPLSNNDTPNSFVRALEKLEEEYQENMNSGIVVHTGDEKLLVKVGEYGWYDIGKSYCEDEKTAMNHCGNEVGKRRTTDKILSLRSHEKGNDYRPHLTFILEKGGFLGEMKGRANAKPSKKYHEAIIALLKLDIIKGVKGGGYAPENNFSLEDLTQSQLEDLKKSKGKDWVDMNAVLENPLSIQNIENPSEEIQLAVVSKNGMLIKFIDNPSEKVQVAAVKNHPIAITYIDNPSDLVLVAENPLNIKDIKNPSEEVQLLALSNERYETSHLIKFIENPSEEAQIISVSKYRMNLEVIIEKGIIPSEKVQVAAATSMNSNDYRYVLEVLLKNNIDPSDKILYGSFAGNSNVIYNIENPTKRMIEIHKELWGNYEI